MPHSKKKSHSTSESKESKSSLSKSGISEENELLNTILSTVSPPNILGDYDIFYLIMQDRWSTARDFQLLFITKEELDRQQITRHTSHYRSPPRNDVYYLTGSEHPTLLLGYIDGKYIKEQFKQQFPRLIPYLEENYLHSRGDTITIRKGIPLTLLKEMASGAKEKYFLHSVLFHIEQAAHQKRNRDQDLNDYRFYDHCYNAHLNKMLSHFKNQDELNHFLICAQLTNSLKGKMRDDFLFIMKDMINLFLKTGSIDQAKKLEMAMIGTPMSIWFDFNRRSYWAKVVTGTRQEVNRKLGIKDDPLYLPKEAMGKDEQTKPERRCIVQ